jgi:Domain of unknown function (DUF222)
MEAAPAVDTESVRALLASLRSLAPARDDADRIDRVRLFEELKSVAAAAQALEARDFEVSQRAAQAVAGVPTSRQGRGIAGQVALARRVSPWAAKRWLGWAGVLTRELPQTFAALQAGRISEWRATIVARETIWLSREDRAQVDAELASGLPGWGDRQVEAEAKKAAYRLDPHGFLARVRGAEKDRRVTVRPAPDTMCRLTALLPVAQGVAAYAALGRAADTTVARGDERGRDQIMADTLVERITGQSSSAAVPVEIELVMTDRTLLGDLIGPGADGADEPGTLVGYGPVPAGLARELALGTRSDPNSGTDSAPRWLRRLFLHPRTGQLAAMDSKRRLFTGAQSRFVRLRDQQCRTPWCDAPIRHTDHVRAHEDGGRTHVANAGGECEACNYGKEAAGWRASVGSDGTIRTRTPTGHVYDSELPRPPDIPAAGRAGIRVLTSTRVMHVVYHSEHPAHAA